ncbi:glycoside hydrolase family 13 protein [Actinoplanes sp. LDG1-06]|uniref:Glycoside hydrolase family 13 protein n=1 Tax=Paractinoplanes ovalisporus TaxID=2810368 RepID=A0ABS2AEY9_9ACTN|nr:glycoside hydrolase family 13 protein [Actinoplanes ovalisporus]MBM2618391.1 glycoside hydrolase family 13 protein [Actinoplanes ovalisporus]
MSPVAWWRRAVFYQVYVWSFADSDGDGIGDLPGVRSRLPYLRDLGVDAVWLNPFYPSPQADNGYDVADYRDVDPTFGTLADAHALIRDAHALGLRVIIDLVPNHTSAQHPWFRAALADGPGSRARARYLFRDGRGVDGAQPPNNWTSNFGGRAWTRAPDGQWYLHLFAPEQPDLDWTAAEVRDEFHSILRFWLDHGVDGFRIDVAHGLAKDPQMPDLGEDLDRAGASHPHWDVDEVHDVYRGWRRVLDDYPGDRMFVGEVVVQSVERLALYLRPDELHTAFNFALLRAPWQASALRQAIDDSIGALAQVGAPPTWVLSNHDETRHVTRYGGGTLGLRRARAAILMMLALPGGAYLYQGEELGLPEVTDLPDRVRRDPVFFRSGGAAAGRDGCRVPLPWSGTTPSLGFGPGHETWLPQPPSWRSLTVERQTTDPASMLSLYRTALAMRHQIPALAAEDLTWLPAAENVLAFRRGRDFVGVVNVGDTAAPLPAAADPASLLLASDTISDTLPPATAAWFG